MPYEMMKGECGIQLSVEIGTLAEGAQSFLSDFDLLS